MAIQAFLANQNGKVLAEIEPDFDVFPWQLNKISKTFIVLSRKDPKATRTNLEIGNLVYFEFDNGLPAWAGTIELPRKWEGDTIKSTVQTIDHMLDFRITGKSRNFYNVPVGTIFSSIIAEAQSQSLNINMGTVWGGGSGHSPRYHLKSVTDILQNSLCKMEGCDYAFVPQLVGGVISFMAELYAIRGTDKSGKVALIENVNVSSAVLEEQGPIVNAFVAAGTGTTWGNERAIARTEEQTSIRDYRLREAADVFIGVSLNETLESHANEQIKENSFPHVTFALEVSNTQPALFGSYDIGDIVRLILHSYHFGGYDNSVRVLAREFNPATGKCALVVEEPSLPILSVIREEVEND